MGKVAVAAGLIWALTGCVTSGVCPAIGWGSSVVIELVGPTNDVDSVRLCVDGHCTTGPQALPDEPLVVATVDPSIYATIAPRDPSEIPTDPSAIPAVPFELSAPEYPAPSDESYLIGGFAEQVDNNTWRIDMYMGAAGEVTVQALSADGSVLAETVTELEFVRVGGTAGCGGPTRAEVELAI